MNKNKIVEIKDGIYEATISFDITEHGHYFGTPRNYNLKKVQALVRSKINQEHIKGGYAICMYGHGARSKKQGFIASEVNYETNNLQEPIGKMVSMSIRDKVITYTVRIVVTKENKGQSVIDLIKGGIGGFSFVWNVEQGFLYGADFVLQPNFNGNRVVMDSVCTTGECALGGAMEDVVKDAIGDNEALFDKAYDLLANQDDVYTALKFKETMQTKMDAITKEKEALKDELENLKAKVSNKNKSISALKKENEELKKEQVTLDSMGKEKDDIQVKYDSLLQGIQDSGLSVVDDELKVSVDAFGKLFESEAGVLFDDVDIDMLGTKVPEQDYDTFGVMVY